MAHRTLVLPAHAPGIPEVARSYQQVLFRRTGDRGHAILALGAQALFVDTPGKDLFQGWRSFLESHRGWSMGWLAYDLKNRIDQLESRWPDPWGLPDIRWFVPQHVVEWFPEQVLLHTLADEEELRSLVPGLLRPVRPSPSTPPPKEAWVEATSRQAYMDMAHQAMHHLQRGDIYEINLCVARSIRWPDMDTFGCFNRLLQRTDAPFAAFGRWGDHYTLCASPERYLRLEGQQVFAEPMKGTRPRSEWPDRDLVLAGELGNDPKERAENVMATDVVRNDLSRVALPGSVRVDELCGVRSYAQVHQMVSRVSAELDPGKDLVDLVRATFPMASMTGAPKIRAMHLIDRLEDRRRSWFSGSMGWIAPGPVADLNVVIRSVQHDARTGYTELITGSALTACCDPAAEWVECALKAGTVLDLLHGPS